jgi:CBS domain-containing protein
MNYTRTLSLRDIIDRRPLLTAKPTDLIRSIACKMPSHKTGAAAVIDESGKLIGILTERDIVQKAVGVFRNVDETTVEVIMSHHPVTISVKSSISYALSVMTSKGFRHLPVMDGASVIGILDIRDLYDAMEDALSQQIKRNEEMLSFAYGAPYSASFSDMR